MSNTVWDLAPGPGCVSPMSQRHTSSQRAAMRCNLPDVAPAVLHCCAPVAVWHIGRFLNCQSACLERALIGLVGILHIDIEEGWPRFAHTAAIAEQWCRRGKRSSRTTITPSCSATTGAGPEYPCVGSKRPRCSARVHCRGLEFLPRVVWNESRGKG
jgi:hypothetical protein